MHATTELARLQAAEREREIQATLLARIARTTRLCCEWAGRSLAARLMDAIRPGADRAVARGGCSA